jgi:hypothetical protein
VSRLRRVAWIPFELTEYLGLALVYVAIAVSAPPRPVGQAAL